MRKCMVTRSQKKRMMMQLIRTSIAISMLFHLMRFAAYIATNAAVNMRLYATNTFFCMIRRIPFRDSIRLPRTIERTMLKMAHGAAP